MDTFYSVADIAALHGVTTAAASNWVTRGLLPTPALVTVGGLKVWTYAQVAARPTAPSTAPRVAPVVHTPLGGIWPANP